MVTVDIAKVLADLKGKVLDVKDVELLRHAYELQQENLNQVKSNNDLLKEKADLLTEQNQELKTRVAELQDAADQLDKIKKRRSDRDRRRERNANLQPDDYVSILRSWMGRRFTERNREVMHFEEIDDNLDLPAGTARKHLVQAAQEYGYRPRRITDKTVQFMGGETI